MRAILLRLGFFFIVSVPSALANERAPVVFLGEWIQDGSGDRGALTIAVSENGGAVSGRAMVYSHAHCTQPFILSGKKDRPNAFSAKSTEHVVCGFTGGRMEVAAEKMSDGMYAGTYAFMLPIFPFPVTTGRFTAIKQPAINAASPPSR